MMKTQRLLPITASFLALSTIAQAAETIPTCEDLDYTATDAECHCQALNGQTVSAPECWCHKLGYTVPATDCFGVGGTPLLCPLANGMTDDKKLSLCYTKSCRGYPLWKEGNTYYHLNRDGIQTKVEYKDGSTLDDYVASFKTCTTGSTNDKVTYFKVEQCKAGMLYINDICDIGCTADKYPYDAHPGDMAGTVEMCEDESGEHYGYSSCNDGWTFNSGQCTLSSCDIKEYPYLSNPNLINNEVRGETQTCRIGGNAYYKYTACKENYTLNASVCTKICDLTNCQATPTTITNCIPVRNAQGEITSYNSCTYNDWSCEIDSTCRVGDKARYNGIVLGHFYHIKNNASDKSLIFRLSSAGFASGAYENHDIASIVNITDIIEAKNDFAGKVKTTKVINYTDNPATNFKAVTQCYVYSLNCPVGSVCAKGEWYLSALGELEYLYDNRYILYSIMQNSQLLGYSPFRSVSEAYPGSTWIFNFSKGRRYSEAKYAGYPIAITLAFQVLETRRCFN